MKILALIPRRELPSTRLRLREPAILWEEEKVVCRFVSIPSGPLGRSLVLRDASRHDAVILQKKTSLREWDLLQLVRANPNVVFDFDDAVMFHELEHGDPLSGKHFRKFLRTVHHAKAVVAGNHFLARFARDAGSDVTILPTPVDPDRYVPRAERESRPPGFVIGWLGVSQNQKYLKPLRNVFKRLYERFPFLSVKIVSEKFPVDLGVPTVQKPWNQESESRDIASFDVGIMPLPDNLWAWGKCGYKLIQYLASGVPVVASPVGLNLDIVREGWNGFLARDLPDWEDTLARLIQDPEMARDLGKRGIEDVRSRFSIRAYASAYLDLLRRVV